MSLDKAIQHGKEHRKKFRGAKAIDCSCRNHGSCSYCLGNRLHSTKKRKMSLPEKEQEYVETCAYIGDPEDVEMNRADELMERFGFDPDDRDDMIQSGMFYRS